MSQARLQLNANQVRTIAFLAMTLCAPVQSQEAENGPQFGPDGRPEFSFLDANGDGKITRDEVSFLQDQEAITLLFLLDVNGDGVVDEEEYNNPPEDESEVPAVVISPVPNMEDRPDFEILDSNSDGTITREEAQLGADERGVAALFMLDTNNDGVIDRAEYEDRPLPEMEEVRIVGSRLLDTESMVSPVNVISAEDMALRPARSMTEFLQQNLTSNYAATDISQSSINDGNTRNGGNRGVGVNLRGFGAENTLVLLNGKRTIEYPAYNRDNGWRIVDVNATLPSIAVGNVQVLSDGGSALYGSDAVSGVVNIVPDYYYEGAKFEIRTQALEEELDKPDSTFAGMFGVGNDTTHFVFAGDYRKAEYVSRIDAGLDQYFPNPEDGGELVYGENARFLDGAYTYAPATLNADGNYDIENGTVGQVDPLCGDTSAFGIDPIQAGEVTTPEGGYGYGAPIATQFAAGSQRCELFNESGAENQAAQQEREDINLFAALSHQLTDKVYLRSEIGYSRQKLDDHNPYLRGDMWVRNGQTFTDLDAQMVMPVDHPALEYYRDTYGMSFPEGADGVVPIALNFGNFNQDIPSENEYEQIRGAFDIEWDINDLWSMNAGVVFATNSVDNSVRRMHMERATQALQGLGGPNCDPETGVPGEGGCEFWNPTMSASLSNADTLGIGNSGELARWITPYDESSFKSDFYDISFSLQGEVQAIQLPAGPLGLAVGASSRNDAIDIERSQFSQDAVLHNQTLPATNFDDDATINAVFFELALPAADNLDFQVAGRYEDSNAGNGYDSFDPKVGFNFRPTMDVTVRGSWGTSFRAPSLIHASDIVIQESVFLFTRHPDVVQIPEGQEPSGDPDNPTNPSTFPGPLYPVNNVQSGNPDIQPQTSTNYTLGTDIHVSDMFQWSDEYGRLSVSLDYVRIDFEDVITLATGRDRLLQEGCFIDELNDIGEVDSVLGMPLFGGNYWEYIPTNPETDENGNPAQFGSCFDFLAPWSFEGPNVPNNVFGSPENLASLDTQAIDLGIDYTVRTPVGMLIANPSLTYILQYDIEDASGSGKVDGIGKVLLDPAVFITPEYRVNAPITFVTGRRGEHTLTLSTRYVSEVEFETGQSWNDALTFDLFYSWNVSEALRVGLSISNLTDEIDDDLDSVGTQLPPWGRRWGLQLAYEFQ